MDTLLFDAATLCFGKTTKQDSGQSITELSTTPGRFDWGARVRLQIGQDQDHLLLCEYGLNQPQAGQNPYRRNLDVRLTPELVTSLASIDSMVVKTATERCQEFFKSPTLKKEYVPLVKEDTNGNPITRVKVNLFDPTPPTSAIPGAKPRPKAKPSEVSILGEGGVVFPGSQHGEDLVKNIQVLVVVDTPGMWSNATQFGISFTARGLLVKKPPPENGLAMFNLKPGLKMGTSSHNSSIPADEMDDSMMDD